MATQAERSARTRARLVECGATLFAERGYDETPTNLLLESAGASKGALYHHFESKRALFEAVFEREARQSIARAVARTAEAGVTPGLDRLVGTALAWLDEAQRPDTARILLEEGPRVLGFERARDLEGRYSLALMKRGLEEAGKAEGATVPDLDLAARLVNAVLTEAALVGRQASGSPTRAVVEETLRRLIAGLMHAS